MKTHLPVIVAAMFIAIGAVACGDTNEIDESDARTIEIDSRGDETTLNEANPGLDPQGGFWGDGHDEEDTEEDP